jgi:hypothetical protein
VEEGRLETCTCPCVVLYSPVLSLRPTSGQWGKTPRSIPCGLVRVELMYQLAAESCKLHAMVLPQLLPLPRCLGKHFVWARGFLLTLDIGIECMDIHSITRTSGIYVVVLCRRSGICDVVPCRTSTICTAILYSWSCSRYVTRCCVSLCCVAHLLGPMKGGSVAKKDWSWQYRIIRSALAKAAICGLPHRASNLSSSLSQD